MAFAQALSFNKLPAAELGQRLLQWGAADWGQGPVTTTRVQKAKKKNRGTKRNQWMAEVKAFHAGRGQGSSKGFPGAPWWKPPTEEAKKKPGEEEEEEEEDEVEMVEPLGKKFKKDDDDEDDSFEIMPRKRFCVFGP